MRTCTHEGAYTKFGLYYSVLNEIKPNLNPKPITFLKFLEREKVQTVIAHTVLYITPERL